MPFVEDMDAVLVLSKNAMPKSPFAADVAVLNHGQSKCKPDPKHV